MESQMQYDSMQNMVHFECCVPRHPVLVIHSQPSSISRCTFSTVVHCKCHPTRHSSSFMRITSGDSMQITASGTPLPSCCWPYSKPRSSAPPTPNTTCLVALFPSTLHTVALVRKIVFFSGFGLFAVGLEFCIVPQIVNNTQSVMDRLSVSI